MPNSWATRWLDSRVRLATATICTSPCFAKPGICKALVLPPAPIRPTRIFFSDMKQLTFLLTVLTNRRPARGVRHIVSDGAAARHSTACITPRTEHRDTRKYPRCESRSRPKFCRLHHPSAQGESGPCLLSEGLLIPQARSQGGPSEIRWSGLSLRATHMREGEGSDQFLL